MVGCSPQVSRREFITSITTFSILGPITTFNSLGCSKYSKAENQTSIDNSTSIQQLHKQLNEFDLELKSYKNLFLCPHSCNQIEISMLSKKLIELATNLETALKDQAAPICKNNFVMLTSAITNIKTILNASLDSTKYSDELWVNFNDAYSKLKTFINCLDRHLRLTSNTDSELKVFPVIKNVSPAFCFKTIPSVNFETLRTNLAKLSIPEMAQLTQLIIDDDLTKVLEINAKNEIGFDYPVLYIIVKRKINVQGKDKTYLMKFKQTIQEIKSDNEIVGVAFKHVLIDKCPVRKGVNILAYNTMIYLTTSPDNLAQIEVIKGAEIEVLMSRSFLNKTAVRICSKQTSKELNENLQITKNNAVKAFSELVTSSLSQ